MNSQRVTSIHHHVEVLKPGLQHSYNSSTQEWAAASEDKASTIGCQRRNSHWIVTRIRNNMIFRNSRRCAVVVVLLLAAATPALAQLEDTVYYVYQSADAVGLWWSRRSGSWSGTRQFLFDSTGHQQYQRR